MVQAVHAQNDDQHLAMLDALRVIIRPCGDQWFAQGVEIDYAASASSKESARTAFAEGLAATIRMHLNRFHSISKLLVWTPEDEWKPYLSEFNTLHLVTLCDKEHKQIPYDFPFHTLKFLEQSNKAA